MKRLQCGALLLLTWLVYTAAEPAEPKPEIEEGPPEKKTSLWSVPLCPPHDCLLSDGTFTNNSKTCKLLLVLGVNPKLEEGMPLCGLCKDGLCTAMQWPGLKNPQNEVLKPKV
uniref:Putative secreted protein n=1 Tax=Amblyomma triste TaxID=251400 RepID=A0A023G499_AMBTT